MTDIRPAATVILYRFGEQGLELYLQRRARGASFMSSAFVFPGGAVDPGETDAREAACRELFEEAGVLLARDLPSPDTIAKLRRQLLSGARPFRELLADTGLTLELDSLRYFARWITPSVEGKRFSAEFFVAELPADQTPSPDDHEAVEDRWLSPTDALRSNLYLPPPQLRTMYELSEVQTAETLCNLIRGRQEDPHPILPRLLRDSSPVRLLFPWDKQYDSHGLGDSYPLPASHPHCRGPSRVVRTQVGWRLVADTDDS